MELWEKEQERLIKERHALEQSSYVPLTKEQQRKNIEENWIVIVDDNGEIRYVPKNNVIAGLSSKKSALRHPIKAFFLFVWHVFELVFLFSLVLFIVSIITLWCLKQNGML